MNRNRFDLKQWWHSTGMMLTFILFSSAAVATVDEEQQPKATEEGLRFFEAKIRPVLVEHCYRCHSAEGSGIRGGLAVDSRDALLAGGESGPAIVPGDLDQSLL